MNQDDERARGDLDDPFARFQRWYEDAARTLAEPEVMTLATVGEGGRPSARSVLLRGFDRRGLCFYTDLGSRKSRELAATPLAALCIYWPPSLQVRVEGRAEPVSDEEADRYFATRPRPSQLGAWASRQSEALADRRELDERVAEMTSRFAGRDVPRPPGWSGFRVVPDRFEFWVRGEARLHDRDEYVLEGGVWRRRLLYP
jgi:pyridoxamine 5'-phosphate oxidase